MTVPEISDLALPYGADSPARGGAVSPTRPGTARSEASLVAAVRAGSEVDLEILFRRHWAQAYRTALLIVHDHAAAEDIAQEGFLAALRHLDRFDVRRRFGPWLAKIVANRAIDWTRMRAARRETTTVTMPEAAAGAEAEIGTIEELLHQLGRLSPEHRAVIVLRYVGDLSPGEIARALDIPRGTVNSRLRRGLDQLGEQMTGEERG